MEGTFDRKFVSSVGKKVYQKRVKDGYVYTLSKTVKGVEYWKCSLRQNCAATLIQNGNDVKNGRKGWNAVTNEHNTHPQDFIRCEQWLNKG
jgi:hypothetical protein